MAFHCYIVLVIVFVTLNLCGMAYFSLRSEFLDTVL